jgi:Flp pilus assembly protein TadB
MAQTRRKRKHKHRGTQAGTIEARGRTGRRPQTKVEAKKISRERRAARFDRPPTWRSALNRAAISAAVFAVAVVVLFHRPVAAALILGLVMVVLYLPMSYYTDRFLYNRRQRQKQAGSAR